MELKQQKTEFELKEKELVNNKKKELLLSNLQQRMDMTVRFNKLQQSFYEPQKQADFIELMTNQIILTKTEWENYIKEANSIFDNKIDYLSKTYKELTETDLIVIVLIALGLDISDSCVLLNMSKETMYKRRKRIKARLNIDVDLEEWIIQNT
jgi:DNA-binding CsgD family transcriptional regulator